jgi:ATP-binding cassette, subfamily B, bacterial PglK
MNKVSTPKKLWHILLPQQRMMSFTLIVLMFLGMILETLGVGLVIPLLVFITKDDLHIEYPAIQNWFDYIGNPSQVELISMAMIAFAVIYTIKALFSGYFAWFQAKFIADLQINYSQKLFTGYLRQPYTFHLQNNSAQLIHNVTTEVSMFINATESSLIIMTEVSVGIGISMLLLAVEPFGAMLIIMGLVLGGGIVYKTTRGIILGWGRGRMKHNVLRMQHLQQGFGSTKDIKLLGREEEFISQYSEHNEKEAKITRNWMAMRALPRLLLELLAVFSLVSLVLVMISRESNVGEIVTVLGLFTAAAFRLMPSVNRVLSAFQNVRFALPAINKLYDEFTRITEHANKQNTHAEALNFDDEIKLKNISFNYPANEAPVLRNVNITIKKGSTVGFIGTTGAGKSTLVDTVLGLLTPSEGDILIDGININNNLRGWQNHIGYVPQHIYITDDSIRRNIAFGLSNEKIDDDSIWKSIRSAQLEEFIKELPEGLDTVLGEHGVRLSGGQRQRIGIARSLYHSPDILVLDEATSSLDTATERDVMDTIKELHRQKTIIIVAHRLSTVEGCDWLYRLEKGRIVDEGTVEDVLKVSALKT